MATKKRRGSETRDTCNSVLCVCCVEIRAKAVRIPRFGGLIVVTDVNGIYRVFFCIHYLNSGTKRIGKCFRFEFFKKRGKDFTVTELSFVRTLACSLRSLLFAPC